MSARPEPKPLWAAVNDEALREPANVARVLAGMAFTMPLSATPRGAIVWWQPDYLRPGAKAPASHRAALAPANRAMRDAEVLLMLDAPDRVTMIDTYAGEWRTPDNAQRGDDLISLGALRWSCRYGQAANRIARLIGLRSIPMVPYAR